ncbi:hypothetical protein TURU_101844 [Turdus rufiventris]|nr:hypothetical protein TURU_101844 [Turdus rufiventris]
MQERTRWWHEGVGGGAPSIGAEIPLQVMVRTMGKQTDPLQSIKSMGDAEIHLQPVGKAALEKREVPEHLQYIDDIIVWSNTAMEAFEKREKIIQILVKAGFAIKKSKVKGPAQEIQFLGVKWQYGRHQIPTKVTNKITVMSPPTSKKETQAYLGAIGFWRMHIPEYSQIVSPLYLVTHKKNDFHWGAEQ